MPPLICRQSGTTLANEVECTTADVSSLKSFTRLCVKDRVPAISMHNDTGVKPSSVLLDLGVLSFRYD